MRTKTENVMFWNQTTESCQSKTTSSLRPQGGVNQEGFKGGGHFKPSLKGKPRGSRLLGVTFPNHGRAGLTKEAAEKCVPGQQRDSLPDVGNPTNRVMRSPGNEIIVGQQLEAHRCPGAIQPFSSPSCSLAGLKASNPLPCILQPFLLTSF